MLQLFIFSDDYLNILRRKCVEGFGFLVVIVIVFVLRWLVYSLRRVLLASGGHLDVLNQRMTDFLGWMRVIFDGIVAIADVMGELRKM